jgi:hypothetical protein
MRKSLSSYYALSLVSLLLALPVMSQDKGPDPSKSKATELEQRLRQRCEGLYTAIQHSQWRRVESFLNEDAKIAWMPLKKMAIYGFTVKAVSVAADGKTGATEVIMDQPVSGSGSLTRVKLPQTVQWAWEEGDWYALIGGILSPVPSDWDKLRGPGLEKRIPSDLEFTSDEYDFKFIRQGETIRAKFYFTNKSDHVVRAAAAIFNPCECATARVNKNRLNKPSPDGWVDFKPGEEGWVEVTMGTKEFGGNIQQGLEVNEQPSGAKVTLQFRGYVLLPHEKAGDRE